MIQKFFESWRYAPEWTCCNPNEGGCGAVLIDGVWVTDEATIDAYNYFLLGILDERYRQVYGD